jgi:hypothetical protein
MADGTFTGTTQSSTFASERGVSSGNFGHWSVDKNGWLCAEGTTSKGDHKFKGCSFLYRLGEKYYVAFGSKPEGAVYERTIKHGDSPCLARPFRRQSNGGMQLVFERLALGIGADAGNRGRADGADGLAGEERLMTRHDHVGE